MPKYSYFLILVLTTFFSACSSETNNRENTEVKNIQSFSCKDQSLNSVSESFLTHLLNGDVKAAEQFYAENSKEKGKGYGINYTFFPENDPNALFDIIQKNAEDKIFVEPMGDYQDGQLVGFFQSSAKGKTTSIDYLRQNHGKTFVVCSFECEDGDWKISGQTCFEDSGSPFE